jgi:hypothetical protein
MRSELAHQNVSYQESILDAINSASQDSQNTSSIDDGFAIPFLEFVTSKLKQMRRRDTVEQLQQDIRAVIRDTDSELIKTSLSPSMDASRQTTLQRRILASLYYTGMEDREGRIAETFGSTFQWIFRESPHDQRKWHNFKQCLQSDSQLY